MFAQRARQHRFAKRLHFWRFPAFVFVGCAVRNEIGFSDRIFGLAEKAIGHIPGGLGDANVLAEQ